ncbi:hypothetical protein [Halorussus caseinilyticus]|uniref:Transposase n=1 Tax=Halorussus caseinilyticus TaxID=3034025 RepID=A0ABD5WKS1_9EURY|nr:hypothetical protein [Halorussus sp. DT72]
MAEMQWVGFDIHPASVLSGTAFRRASLSIDTHSTRKRVEKSILDYWNARPLAVGSSSLMSMERSSFFESVTVAQ